MKSDTKWQQGIKLARRLVYAMIVVLLSIFLWDLGAGPWQHAFAHWPVMIAVMIFSVSGLVVQAMAFRGVSVIPASIGYARMLEIWSASAVMSILAPFMAGIATRTALLVRHGAKFSECVAGSLRQVWMGVEYALLCSVLSLPFTGWPFSLQAVIVIFMAWSGMLLLRLWSLKRRGERSWQKPKFSKMLDLLQRPVPISAHLWFFLQILSMSAIYYVSFNGLGAEFGLMQAVALSALTVLISLIVFVPNGLGVTDALWIFIASDAGLLLEQAVAVAIAIRIAHFLASALVHITIFSYLRFTRRV